MRLLGIVAAAALAVMPVVAQATVTVDAPGLIQDGTVPISIGDVFTIEIFGDAVDGAGSAAFGFTATEQLLAIETNSLNPIRGFRGATVEWNSAAVLSSETGPPEDCCLLLSLVVRSGLISCQECP